MNCRTCEAPSIALHRDAANDQRIMGNIKEDKATAKRERTSSIAKKENTQSYDCGSGFSFPILLFVFFLLPLAVFAQTAHSRRPVPPGLELPTPGKTTSLAEEVGKLWQQTDEYSQLPKPRTEDDPQATVGLVPRGAPDGVVYRYFFDQRTDPNQ
ncbi:MAG: hypothetical protein FWC43_14645, partial [Planctomycetaceae bacterium]|nr:hypothetical protein [Planctomycetaceae bacterium]